PGRRRHHRADTEFGHAFQVLAALAPEEAETELADMRGIEVLAQAKGVGQIVGANLHLGFADLVRGNRQWMRVAFEHHDGEIGEALAQLQGEAEPGEAATEDDDIRLQVFAHGGSPVEGLPSAANAASARRLPAKAISSGVVISVVT